jgi:hypothetical protein
MTSRTSMDNIQASLIKGMLDRQFYQEYSHKVPDAFLSKQFKPLRATLDLAHKKYARTFTLSELDALHHSSNPTLTDTQKMNLREIFSELDSAPLIGPDVASDVIETFWQQEYGRLFAEVGINMMNGEANGNDGLVQIQSLIERCESQFTPSDDVAYQSTDINDILEQNSDNFRWKFNIPALAKAIPGVAATHFLVGAARPNNGKTSMHATLAAAPGGWAWQGAKVAIALNEESSPRIAARYVTACTGMTIEEIGKNREYAMTLWEQVRHNIHMFRDGEMSVGSLNSYCKRNKPDILIIDMIDKVRVPGSFAREDQMFRELYKEIRELGNRHNTVPFGFSQLSADAEGKTQLNQSMLEGSRTGKAAEADLMLLIGRGASMDESMEDDGLRHINIAKNKINGTQRKIPVMLKRDIGRYVD